MKMKIRCFLFLLFNCLVCYGQKEYTFRPLVGINGVIYNSSNVMVSDNSNFKLVQKINHSQTFSPLYGVFLGVSKKESKNKLELGWQFTDLNTNDYLYLKMCNTSIRSNEFNTNPSLVGSGHFFLQKINFNYVRGLSKLFSFIQPNLVLGLGLEGSGCYLNSSCSINTMNYSMEHNICDNEFSLVSYKYKFVQSTVKLGSSFDFFVKNKYLLTLNTDADFGIYSTYLNRIDTKVITPIKITEDSFDLRRNLYLYSFSISRKLIIPRFQK